MKSKDQVIIFHDDQTITIHSVKEKMEDCVETDENILSLVDAKTRVNTTNGGIIYIFHLDLPAKVEAEKLKQLRRSVALKRALDFDKETGTDWAKFVPWIIAGLAIIF
jgi:hypothetical protein